ncbi:MAG: phosphatidylserine decarboxylase [Lentisphaerota bacterium]
MVLTHYGRREWLGALLIAVILCAASVWSAYLFNVVIFYYLPILILFIWLCVAAFFRDPKREIPSQMNAFLSPADGTVRDIDVVKNHEYKEIFRDHEVLKIGIFLSVFNVHLNRVPCDVTVKNVIYKEGKFYDARDSRATKENESNALLAQAHISGRNFPIVVKQISGAIARRIVCPVNVGDSFKKGQKYGMIKFGSRTEIYMPNAQWVKLKLKIGDKLKAAQSIVAEIEPEGRKNEKKF